MQTTSPPPTAVASDPPARPAPPALPDGITLVSDEQLLWIGRPEVWPTLNGVWLVDRLKMLAWLMIPVAILLYNFLRVPDWLQHNWIFVGIASLWLVAAMWGMTVEPLVSARKRRRTTYLLTSIRAITHVAGKRSQTTSTLLDMSTSVTLTQRGDETGDVWISVGATFERVRDAHLVQQIAIEAVRRAGTPMPLPPMTPATPEQQPRAEK